MKVPDGVWGEAVRECRREGGGMPSRNSDGFARYSIDLADALSRAAASAGKTVVPRALRPLHTFVCSGFLFFGKGDRN